MKFFKDNIDQFPFYCFLNSISHKEKVNLLNWLVTDLLDLGLEDNVGELLSDPMEHAMSSIVAFNPF